MSCSVGIIVLLFDSTGGSAGKGMCDLGGNEGASRTDTRYPTSRNLLVILKGFINSIANKRELRMIDVHL